MVRCVLVVHGEGMSAGDYAPSHKTLLCYLCEEAHALRNPLHCIKNYWVPRDSFRTDRVHRAILRLGHISKMARRYATVRDGTRRHPGLVYRSGNNYFEYLHDEAELHGTREIRKGTRVGVYYATAPNLQAPGRFC